PPTRIGVDPNVLLVTGGNLVGRALPLEPALVEAKNILHERRLEVQTRDTNNATNLSKLRDHDLFVLGNGKNRGIADDGQHKTDPHCRKPTQPISPEAAEARAPLGSSPKVHDASRPEGPRTWPRDKGASGSPGVPSHTPARARRIAARLLEHGSLSLLHT